MEESELIYPLDGLDIIPVIAEEVVYFRKEYNIKFRNEHMIVGNLVWMEVELENGTIFRSNRYEPSEANNLLRLLLKRNDFVLVKLKELFVGQEHIIRLSGVRFSAIIAIGKHLDHVDYVDGNGEAHYFTGEVVKSTAENYEKWKKSQEGENG